MNDDKRLRRACIDGNSDMVKELISKGTNVNVPNSKSVTPIFFACSFSCRVGEGKVTAPEEDIVDLLIQAGADLNISDGEATPLIIVSARGNADCAKKLLAAGADINLSIGDNNPLCFWLDLDDNMSEFMINSGADVNFIKPDGESPLMLAARHRSLKIIKLILEKGANVNKVNAHGFGALSIACVNRDHEIIELLVRSGASVTHKDKDGFSPLILSVKFQDYKTVNFLLDNCDGQIDPRALISAAKSCGKDETLFFLFHYFFDENSEDSDTDSDGSE